MKSVDIFKTIEHVSKHETDKDDPTKWHIKAVDQLVLTAIDDRATEYVEDKAKGEDAPARTTFHFNRKKLDLVRVGLTNVENFIHSETGQPIRFDTKKSNMFGPSIDVVTDEILRQIPGAVLTELADKIEKMSRLSEEEEKNS